MEQSCCGFSSCSSTRISLCNRQQESSWNEPSGRPCHRTPYSSVLGQQRQSRRSLSQQKSRFSPTQSRSWILLRSLMYAVLLSFFFCSIGVKAENVLSSTDQFLGREELLFDRRDPPSLPMRLDVDLEERLDRREEYDHLYKPAIDTNGRDQTTQQTQIPLPSPFDSNIGNNFTSTSCPAFFQNFLSDPSFRNCLPLSLLLQTSTSFFTIQRSPFRLTETLDATCHVDYQQCSQTMSHLAQQIQLDEHCGKDLAMQNPIAVQAYNGFIAYQPLYNAGCLKDENGDFCFAKAVSDPRSSTNIFSYYLPLGVSLPGNAKPACNTCLRNTMSVFERYSSESNQLLASDYYTAAQQIDGQCGPQFVESTVPSTGAAGDSLAARRNNVGLLAMLLCLVYWFVS